MIIEICADSFETTQMAAKFGAKRVELCTALSVGGLTPNYALIESCSKVSGIEVHVMIRHREGDFIYADSDIQIMLNDIVKAKEAGAHGVVFGCLNSANEINIDQCQALANKAKELAMEVTFHRAFDFIKYPMRALEILIGMGVDRILTSGGKPKAIEGLTELTELVEVANGRIQIMAGSGVNSTNAFELKSTGIDALHFTAHKSGGKTDLGMGDRSMPDESKVREVVDLIEKK
jgi:copper homeostasis protein